MLTNANWLNANTFFSYKVKKVQLRYHMVFYAADFTSRNAPPQRLRRRLISYDTHTNSRDNINQIKFNVNNTGSACAVSWVRGS